jgi:hypothetical protein
MTAKRTHPLLTRGEQITEEISAWRLKDHPHTVAGERRGFEVRVYHHPAEGWDPYLVTMISTKEGWVMGTEHSPTAAAAEATAREMLIHLAEPPRAFSASDAKGMIDHVDRVDRLTQTLIAKFQATGVSSAEAQHALAQTLGAVIGSNARSEPDRAAAVSRAADAIATYANDATLLAKFGRKGQPSKTRLN